MKKNIRGLTLIELLAVIAIIAILFVLLIPQISSAIEKSRETGIMVNFRDYETALQQYFFEKSDEEKSVDELNKYIDKELQFSGIYNNTKVLDISNKAKYYQLTIENKNSIRIHAVNQKGDRYNDYILIADYENGEVKTKKYGFETVGEEIKKEGNYRYIERYEGVEIIEYIGNQTNLNIPNELGGEKVVSIGFYSIGFKNLTNVSIPNDVKYIKGRAFNSNKIEEIILPTNLIKIGEFAFYSNKIKNLIIPSNVEEIGFRSFNGNPMTTLSIGNSMEKINGQSFVQTLLTHVEVPSSVTYIDERAFNTATLRTYRILGNPFIGEYAFPETATRQ